VHGEIVIDLVYLLLFKLFPECFVIKAQTLELMLDQGVVHEQGHGLQRCLGTKHLARSHAERYKNVSAPPGDDCYVRQRINHSFDGNDNLDLHGF